MNDALIKQLANKAGCDYLYDYSDDGHAIVCNLIDIEKLIELIVLECSKVAWYHTPDTEELEYSHLIKDEILEHFGVKE